MTNNPLDYRQQWHAEDEAAYKKPNLLQRGLAFVVSVINPYSKFAIGRDFSHWDGPITPAMLEGLDFVVGKMGGSENDPHSAMGNPYEDETFAGNCQSAYDADIPFLTYFFIGARIWLENSWTKAMVYTKPNEEHPIMQTILKQLHAGKGWKRVYEFWMDWEDASLWTTFKGGIPAPWHTFTMDDIRARIAGLFKLGGPTLPQVIYSRKSFVDKVEAEDKQLNFSTWMGVHPEINICTASWPQRIPNTATAAEVRAKWIPLAAWRPYIFGYSAARAKDWLYWQFSGDPDWIMYNGTKEELYERLGYAAHGVIVPEPLPEPEPEPEPVKRYYARVRTSAVGLKLRTGPKVSLDNVLDYDFRPAVRFELAGPPVVDGNITWASLGMAFFAVRQGTVVYCDVEVES